MEAADTVSTSVRQAGIDPECTYELHQDAYSAPTTPGAIGGRLANGMPPRRA